MTPAQLYLMLGLGVAACVGVGVVVWSVWQLPRTLRAASQGRPFPGLVLFALNGAVLYFIDREVPMPRQPGWEHTPIACDVMECGWNYFYVVIVGVSAGLFAVAAVTAACGVCASVAGAIVWLDSPFRRSAEWEAVTNFQSFRRRLSMTMGERSVVRMLAPHLSAHPPLVGSRVFAPNDAKSSFLISAADETLDLDPEAVREIVLGHEMVSDAQYAIWIPATEHFEHSTGEAGQDLWLRVKWDLPRLEHGWSRLLPGVRRRSARTVGLAGPRPAREVNG